MVSRVGERKGSGGGMMVYSPESGAFGVMLCQLFFSRAKSDKRFRRVPESSLKCVLLFCSSS